MSCIALVFLLSLLSFHGMQEYDSEGYKPTPVILVPGLGNSQAFALAKNASDPFQVWMNLFYLLDPTYLDYYLSLDFDPKTNRTHDKPFADIFFPGWGSTETLENLDTSEYSYTRYFSGLVRHLTLDKYYVRNKTLLGTPYDFRKAPYENTKMLKNLKALIEETVATTEKKVAILGHGMGVMYSLRFFDLMSDEWKKQHIKTFIATSGPFGGSVKMMKAQASGTGPLLLKALNFRPIERSFPSVAFLMPNPQVFSPQEPLIITPDRNYSSNDYQQFFKDINNEKAYTFYELSQNFPLLRQPTGIDEIHCIYGKGHDTIRQAVYSPPSAIYGEFPDQSPTIVYGDGDGTVNIESLRVCQKWADTRVVELPNAEHTGILWDSRYLKIVNEILGSKTIFLSIQRWFKQLLDSFTQEELRTPFSM